MRPRLFRGFLGFSSGGATFYPTSLGYTDLSGASSLAVPVGSHTEVGRLGASVSSGSDSDCNLPRAQGKPKEIGRNDEDIWNMKPSSEQGQRAT